MCAPGDKAESLPFVIYHPVTEPARIPSGPRRWVTGHHGLLAELLAARADGTHHKLLAKLASVELLIIDDFGLRPISAQGAEDLYELIARRYERGSILLTSNRSPSEWAEVFGDALLASAALYRLTHHARVTVITGESYRQRHRRSEMRPGGKEVKPTPKPAKKQ